MYRSIALVDLSYLVVRQYKSRASNTNATPQEVAQGTLTSVINELAATRDSVEHTVLCLDAPPYWRTGIYNDYKGQRPRQDPELTAIKRTLLERIDQDGYNVARVPTFEADDIIATLCHLWHPLCPDIRIVSADKDAAQCVRAELMPANAFGTRVEHVVRMFVPAVGGREEEIRNVEAIFEKFGVYPKDMALFQAMVGDASDNIPGVYKCGPVTAAKWILQCGGDLQKLGVELAKQAELGTKMPMAWQHLAKCYGQIALWQSLTTLRCDVPIDADALLIKRKVQPLVEVSDADDSEFYDPEEERKLMAEPEEQQGFIPFGEPPTRAEVMARVIPEVEPPPPLKPGKVPTRAAGVASEPTEPVYTHDVHGNKLPKAPAPEKSGSTFAAGAESSIAMNEQNVPPAKTMSTESAPSVTGRSEAGTAASVVPPTQGPRKVDPIPSDGAMVRVAPPSWALAAQPNTANEMLAVAKTLINGRFLAHYGTPEGIFTVMALGRELGLGFMAALEGFHIVKNRPWPRAKMLKALAEADPNCVWMQITSSDEHHATIKTEHRKAGLLEYTYTAERARKAGYFNGPNADNWKTKTIEMLEARAMSKAAGRWYSGATMGLHSAEESEDSE